MSTGHGSEHDPLQKRALLVIPVAVIVIVGWFTSLILGFVTKEFTPFTVTTPLMLMLAGYVFGLNIVRRTDGQ